jgi:hypothetical protein
MEYDESTSSPEVPLPGTFSNLAKVGDTVRRSTGPWTSAVHALLRHLERAGFDGAPRVLGVDSQGREVLTFIPGHVPRAARPDVATDRALVEVGLLLRRYHDAVSGFSLPPGIGWYGGADPDPGASSVVCHNDLAPRNTVFRGGSPVAFLDFDLASPDRPAWDVAPSPGSSCRFPTTGVARAKAGCRRPTVPADCACCATAMGSPSESVSDCPSSWSGASKRPLRGSRLWLTRACRRTADGPRRAYQPSFAPTEIGSSGTARICGRPSSGVENFAERR